MRQLEAVNNLSVQARELFVSLIGFSSGKRVANNRAHLCTQPTVCIPRVEAFSSEDSVRE